LAASGVLFTNAHCAAPLCNPSRAAIMTGIRPSTSGVYDNGQPMRQSPVLKDAVSMTQHFRKSGYRVVGGGKIYHGAFPDPASWDEYFPSQKQNKPPDPVPDVRPANGLPPSGSFDWAAVNVPDAKMGDFQVVDWALSELNKKQPQPLFLACGLFRPHLPWYVPSKYFDMFPREKITLPRVKNDDLDDVPPIGKNHGFLPRAADGGIREEPAGPQHHRRFVERSWLAPRRETPLAEVYALGRGYTQRVPDAGSRWPRKELEGKSLRPLLKNPDAAWERPALTTYFRNNHSVRDERWRYVHYADGGEELYDHRTDPQEWTNLASKSEYDFVKRDLARWLPKVNAEDAPHSRGRGEG
jgi:arylsulfatase A-like enzyme